MQVLEGHNSWNYWVFAMDKRGESDDMLLDKKGPVMEALLVAKEILS